MPLLAVLILLPLAACASDEGRFLAGAYPYDDRQPFRGLGFGGGAGDGQGLAGPRIRGVIDDDPGLPDGNLY